jgi:hypothetical protein
MNERGCRVIPVAHGVASRADPQPLTRAAIESCIAMLQNNALDGVTPAPEKCCGQRWGPRSRGASTVAADNEHSGG